MIMSNGGHLEVTPLLMIMGRSMPSRAHRCGMLARMTTLARRLGLADAVFVGLAAMVGAGVFAAFAPAAGAAGSAMLAALALAALVAYCNATSSARLAARHPESGGTYVYGTRRLGPAWGFVAGWSFVVGKVASCAAIALTFGAYVAPRHPRPFAVAAVVAVAAVDYRGVTRSARVTRVLVVVTLLALAAAVAASLSGEPRAAHLTSDADWLGVPRAAGLLFFAFAGYARVATLGEEVRDPERTIPRAVAISLGITLAVYAAVAVATLLALGPTSLAGSAAPVADAARTGAPSVVPLVRVGAAVATLGSLMALVLGVSRTAFAMARDGWLPAPLASVHPRHRVPHVAELAVAAVVAVLVATVDLRGAIGFSSFGVLTYYAIANASALTLREHSRRVPLAGLAGCALLALTLPLASVLTGAAVVAAGAIVGRMRS